MNEQTGYIYLIKAGEHYKIGKSINVARRMREFSLPFPVELLHTIPVPDMAWAERHLHTRFVEQRSRGEWFTLSPDDITWICSLETIEPEPEPPAPEPEPGLKLSQSPLSRPSILRVQEWAKARGLNLSQLQAAVNKRLTDQKPVAMGTMRRYWYSTKDGKETGEPIELADLHLLGTIAHVLEVPLSELLNEGELGNSPPVLLAA